MLDKYQLEALAQFEAEQKALAEEHWKYVESICHKMYVDAFLHGIKHGKKIKH